MADANVSTPTTGAPTPPSSSNSADGTQPSNTGSADPAKIADSASHAPERKGALDASEAGRILAEAKASIRRGKAPAPKDAATPSTTETASTANGEQPPSAQTKDPAATTAKTEAPADPKTPTADAEAAERLAALVQGGRKLTQERERFEADKKTHEPLIATGKAIHEARSKGDHLGAAVAAGYRTPEEKSELLMALVGDLKEPEAFDPAKLPELVDARVKAELAAAKEAEATARRDAGMADMSAASGAFAEAAIAELKANPDKYPLVRAKGITAGWKDGEPVGQLDKFIIDHHRRTGSVPNEIEVLDHFQAQYEAEITAAGYVRKPAAAAAPAAPAATPVSGDWTRDARGAAAPETAAPKRESLADKTNAILEKARALDVARERRAS